MKLFENYKKLVEKELKRIFVSFKDTDVPKVLYDAMHYSVFNGGKRIRPVLCIATYDAINSKRKTHNSRLILPFACGLEFIHTFSLIQDDLPCMDDDDFRRGKPSLHKAFNEGIALLAADALFAMAFQVFGKAKVDDKIKIKAINQLSNICGANGLVAGQILDITKKRQEVRNKRQEFIDRKKTAALIAGAMRIGAIVAGASERIIKQIERAGIYLGLLFQVTDDILDSQVGKHEIMAKSVSYAQKAKRIFRNLGDNFKDFIIFTDYIFRT